MDRKEREGNPRDRPCIKDQLTWLLSRWGADILLMVGALLVSVGSGQIYPPAGLIAAGVLLIVGGVLWARGGGSP